MGLGRGSGRGRGRECFARSDWVYWFSLQVFFRWHFIHLYQLSHHWNLLSTRRSKERSNASFANAENDANSEIHSLNPTPFSLE